LTLVIWMKIKINLNHRLSTYPSILLQYNRFFLPIWGHFPGTRRCSRTEHRPLRRWPRCRGPCRSAAASSRAIPRPIGPCPQSDLRQLGCSGLCPGFSSSDVTSIILLFCTRRSCQILNFFCDMSVC